MTKNATGWQVWLDTDLLIKSICIADMALTNLPGSFPDASNNFAGGLAARGLCGYRVRSRSF